MPDQAAAVQYVACGGHPAGLRHDRCRPADRGRPRPARSAAGRPESSRGSAPSGRRTTRGTLPVPAEGTVRNLLPSGRAPVRTASAAVLTAVLFGGAAAHFGRDLVLAPFCVFFAMLVVVSVTDLSHRLVPRRLLYAALALIAPLLVASAAIDHQWHDLTGAVVAGAVAFGLFFGDLVVRPPGHGLRRRAAGRRHRPHRRLPEPAPCLRGLPRRFHRRAWSSVWS